MLNFESTPVNEFLGLQLLQSDASVGKVELPSCKSLTQEGGVVHGGVLSILADTAAVYAVRPHLEDGDSMTSIEFKLNFFRPGLGDGGAIIATAKVIKTGRKINVCESTVTQDGRELAYGLFTYLVLENVG